MMIVLKATDLLKKHGFGDGDLFDDLLEEAGYDVLAENTTTCDEDEQFFGHAVLTAVIRTYLMPKLVGFDLLEQVSCSHNPVRIHDDGNLGDVLNGVASTVTAEQVVAIASQLAGAFPGAASTTPTATRGRV